jgi:hypothetical protein
MAANELGALQDRRMFGRGDNDVPAIARLCERESLQCQVVGLAAAAREQDFVRIRGDERPAICPRACSMAARRRKPKACALDGLPEKHSTKGRIASTTLKWTGVVAL